MHMCMPEDHVALERVPCGVCMCAAESVRVSSACDSSNRSPGVATDVPVQSVLVGFVTYWWG
jgi:hypothetical protein